MKLNMQGQLSKCLLLAYRTPAASVRDLLPQGLELITHGPWAFWNVVVCDVEKMRPTVASVDTPGLCGISYRHVAYRLYVKAATQTHGRLRGLYFVRSDADHCLISRGGNLMSDFKFHGGDIRISDTTDEFAANITSTRDHEADGVVRARRGEPALLPGSCFASFEEARAMLKYQPLGLSASRSGNWLKLAEVFRDENAWSEESMQIEEASLAFFNHMKQHDVHLELATRIAPLAYRWRLGRRVKMAADQGFSAGSPASFQAR